MSLSGESETGMSTVAYFIGKCLADLPLVTLYSFVYAVAFMTVAAVSGGMRSCTSCLAVTTGMVFDSSHAYAYVCLACLHIRPLLRMHLPRRMVSLRCRLCRIRHV